MLYLYMLSLLLVFLFLPCFCLVAIAITVLQAQREKLMPTKSLPPVKALLAQSIPSALSAKTKRKYLKHANSESNSNIVIITIPTKPKRKCRMVTGLGLPLYFSH